MFFMSDDKLHSYIHITTNIIIFILHIRMIIKYIHGTDYMQ